MAFKLGPINFNAVAQGVGGLVFGNEDQSTADEDRHVERLLDRISNGVLADDRRAAMAELQSIVAESRSAQLAFGAMGFPVLLSVLKEERDDVEMARGALETLVSSLTPLGYTHGLRNEVQPALMNSDLLSRESESISLLLSLLSEDDFYIRYYTLQTLTALLTNSPNRLQEAILATPRGITRLMDMLMDREVLRNEALLLLTYLTREAEEIQKIVVFEGAFEKIFSIIKEEGGSEGGVVVQDCLELLNNLIRNSVPNQILLRETVGFESLISILKLRKGNAYNFTQQKTVNLLSALGTIELLLVGSPENDPGKDANRRSNQTVLAQKKILDSLLMLGVEGRWTPVMVRCSALRCVGDLVARHPQNIDFLTSKMLGEEHHVKPALNAILSILLQTPSLQERIAAEYVIKCFCERNPEGQMMLASTMTPQPLSSSRATLADDIHLPFGSLLLHGLVLRDNEYDLETCCRAASVLSHILKDNLQCKERVLRIELEDPAPSLVSSEPLMHRIVKYLALAASTKTKEQDPQTHAQTSYIQPAILRLMITWLGDCPNAVDTFLSSPAHLPYLIELILNSNSSPHTKGLAAILLGECVVFNKSMEDGRDAFMVVDAISQKIGLTAYFMKVEELQRTNVFVSSISGPSTRRPLLRSTTEATEVGDMQGQDEGEKHEHVFLVSLFDGAFVEFIKSLEVRIREGVVEIFSHPKKKVAAVPSDLEQQQGEGDRDYITRLKDFIEKQCLEMQDLLGRNAGLAEDLAQTRGEGAITDISAYGGRERVHSEPLHRELHEAQQRIETLKSEKAKVEADSSKSLQMAKKLELDLKSLSDAYNSLEQANFRLESEVKVLRVGGGIGDLEAAKAEVRAEVERETEAELNDLLVCLGQEQSKVERLGSRLMELGEDVDSLLEGIGDESGLAEEGESED
ncbi:golgin candidate 6 [Amborella trichopoda]|nr:golgin candidate 6 [Amborella trichopoda]|eukprot:XP_011629264.1 golgin candidate 6 [Amborella trichopoda]